MNPGEQSNKRVWYGTVPITHHEQLAERTFRIRLHCPPIAQQITPGQFVMVRLPGRFDPLLGRPLAMYDVGWENGQAAQLELVFLVVGKTTQLLAEVKPGTQLTIWGPLGNGFPPIQADHLIMIAGGIGQTPFLSLAKEVLGQQRYGSPGRPVGTAQRVTLCYGVKSASLLAGVEHFRSVGVNVLLATEDGSAGHRGLVTDLVEKALAERSGKVHLVACGPEPMLAAVQKLAVRLGLPCHVSLENSMACGLGICFGCVQRVRTANSWDYKRVCVDGPIFNIEDVIFDDE